MKENWPANVRHVVNVELSPDANKRQVQVDILTGFQDPARRPGRKESCVVEFAYLVVKRRRISPWSMRSNIL